MKINLRLLFQRLYREYRGNFAGDLIAGITTAVVALPLALAFAIASGVDAKYGLYTAIVTGIVAAVVGGSKVQVSGPTGGMAAVLIGVTTQFGYEKVVLIAVMAGFFQVLCGFFKLGRFVKVLPFPLIAGFTMGIGIIIFGGQIDHALGISIHHHKTEFYDRLVESIEAILASGVNWSSVGISAFTIVLLLSISKISSRLPAALISIVVASFIVFFFHLNVAHIHDIPRGLPSPHFPAFSWDMFRELLRPAATVAALGAIESLLAAVVADTILGDGSRHHPNRELIGQGFANMATGFFGGIPCTGAIARTAVNIKSGGRTRLAAVTHAIVLLLAMLFLAPLADHIPIPALAGVLIVTSIRMVEWRDVRWMMKAPASDITIMLVTVLVTVFTDLVMAVEFGLAAASILFIQKMSDLAPQLVPIHSANSQTVKVDHANIGIFRIPGPLFWGGSHAIVEALEKCENFKAVILKMQYVSHIDASGVATLKEAKSILDERGIRLILVDVPPRTLGVLTQMGMTREVKNENIFPHLEDALLSAQSRISS